MPTIVNEVFKNWSEQLMYHYLESGLKNIWLKDGYASHQTEYGEGVSIHDLEGLHKTIGLDVVHQTPALDGNDVRFLRKEMDLTQSALASILRVSEDTIRNYENRTQIPEPTELLLRKFYIEHIQGDGSLRDLVHELSRLNRELAKHKRQFVFIEHTWKAA